MSACSIDGCGRDVRCRGMCHMHYLRSWRARADRSAEVARAMKVAGDRAWKYVDVGVCWQWTGGRTAKGYGLFWDGAKCRRAHRWAWEHLVGPIPEGLEIDHLCHNTSCVNPDHMEVVTQEVNLARRRRFASAGR